MGNFVYKDISTLKKLVAQWDGFDVDRKQKVLLYLMENDKRLLQDWIDYRRLTNALVGDDGKGDANLEKNMRMTIVTRSANASSSSEREKTLNERHAESEIGSMDDEEIDKLLADLQLGSKKMPVLKNEKQ